MDVNYQLLSLGFKDSNSPLHRLPVDILPLIMETLQLLCLDFCDIVVDESLRDPSVFSVTPDTLDALGGFRGDVFLFSCFNYNSHSNLSIPLIALNRSEPEDPLIVEKYKHRPNKRIYLPNCVVEVLKRRLKVSSLYSVKLALEEVQYGKRVVLSFACPKPAVLQREQPDEFFYDEELFTQFWTEHVIPFFVEAYRPVALGDIFVLHGNDVIVTECEPTPCIVSPDTIVASSVYVDESMLGAF
jgi:hypothetical protein